MTESRTKDISDNFVVLFKGKPHTSVEVHGDDKLLGYRSFPGREKALDVYKAISSSKDARDFVKIIHPDFDPVQDMNGRKNSKLMRIMGT